MMIDHEAFFQNNGRVNQYCLQFEHVDDICWGQRIKHWLKCNHFLRVSGNLVSFLPFIPTFAKAAFCSKSFTRNVPFSSVLHDPLVTTDRYNFTMAVGVPRLQYVLLRILDRVSYLPGLKSLVHRTSTNCLTFYEYTN